MTLVLMNKFSHQLQVSCLHDLDSPARFLSAKIDQLLSFSQSKITGAQGKHFTDFPARTPQRFKQKLPLQRGWVMGKNRHFGCQKVNG